MKNIKKCIIKDKYSFEETGDIIINSIKNNYVLEVITPYGCSDIALKKWTAVVDSMGVLLSEGEDGITGKKNGESWLDVQYIKNRQHTFRHSNSYQPLHTDGSYDDSTNDVTMFVCFKKAHKGGESIFVTADKVASICSKVDKELFQDLCTVPISFGKNNSITRKTTILSKVNDGWDINWNYYRVIAATGTKEHFVKEKFYKFLEDEMLKKGNCYEHMIKEGSAIFFRDKKILHGRKSFLAKEDGDRLIWKCSFNFRPLS